MGEDYVPGEILVNNEPNQRNRPGTTKSARTRMDGSADALIRAAFVERYSRVRASALQSQIAATGLANLAISHRVGTIPKNMNNKDYSWRSASSTSGGGVQQTRAWQQLNLALFKGLLCFMLIATGDVMFGAAGLTNETALCARALVSQGDWGRLQHEFARAQKGENMVVGVIGGSITQGAAASSPENRYGNLVASWWRETFPKAKVTFINAGIGATGSDYGALRVQRDLLSHKPDFVIVEYAVNDGNTQASAETLEGLLRQILKQPNHPAVVMLFMMNQRGGNAQEWFAKVGDHYGLPMISYRDSLWAEIQAGRMTWRDISPDEVHPNDRGHAYAARFVTSLLDQARKTLPADDALPRVPDPPTPRFTDLFEHTALIEADLLKPTTNSGWSLESKSHCWKSDQPGSRIEFGIEGRVIFTMHYVVKGPMGRAKVSVDGKAATDLEGWFDQTWGGYRQTRQVAQALAPGKHRVCFEILPEKSHGSTGHEFRILGLGCAGN